jgi:uncharacterized protein (TIGR03086 family)
MTTSANANVELLDAVLADLARVVGAITEDQLHDPTPCTDYDVGQLQGHVLGWLTNFAAGFADPQGQAPLASVEGYQTTADPSAEVRAAGGLLAQAIRGGAAVRPLKLGDAAMPGEMALSMILWEYQVHGWDLARATGQTWNPPAAAAEASLAFAPAMLTPDYQGAGKPFADAVAVPDGASPLERLLGLSGRHPNWPAS